MRLSVKKTKNHVFYYVLESHREGGAVRTSTYEKIGRHDELLKITNDPLAYARRRVDEINAGIRDNKLIVNREIDFSERLEGEGKATERTSLNVGWLYVRKILEELGFAGFLSSISGRFKYDLAAICMYSVCARVIKPGSKMADHRARGSYYGGPDYQLQDAYKCVKLLGANSEGMQKALFDSCKAANELSTDVLYYDCTNFFVECEEEDEDLVDEDGGIVQWGLRRYGFSKEHRPNPIVQMGLFVDKNGIPVSYSLSPGNTNEQITAMPLERRMIEQYGHSRFIYCSDGGLGSFENRFFNTLQQRDYVVTQSLKKTKKEELDAMLTDMNWRFVDDDSPASLSAFRAICDKLAAGKALTEEEARELSRDMIYKEYPMERSVDPSNIAGAKARCRITFSERIFVTFSAKYYLYQRKVFTRQLLRAEGWVERGMEKRRNPNDPARLLKTVSSTENGEIATETEVSVDKEAVAKEESFHGFYAVATSLESGIKEILRINSARWAIEYRFRIMKSEFDSRPMFVSTKESIEGHFAICYAALVAYSVIEKRLKERDQSLTTPAIIATLRNMEVVRQEGHYQSIYTNSKALASLEETFKLGLDRKYVKEKTLKNIFK